MGNSGGGGGEPLDLGPIQSAVERSEARLDLLSRTIDVQGFSHQSREKLDNCHAQMPDKPIFMSECCSCNTMRDEDVGHESSDGRSGLIQKSFNADCVQSQTNASNGADYAVADHGAAPAWANLEAASDQRVQHISQPVFEALLRRAVADADVETRYGRRVVDVGLGGDGVACVLDDGATLDAEYLVAADGPRGAAAGVVLAAAENDAADRVPGVAHHLDAPALQHFVSVAFRSRDLAARLRARPAMLYFVFNRETTSVVVAHDLDGGLFNLQFPVFPPAERPGDAAAPRNVRREVRALTAAPLADLRIESARPWLMRARLADRFALDSHRAFLVGDAAHEMPPSGGFGMNTAVGDAHNLAWKLARASAGAANGRDLLASYERERRPSSS